MSKTGWQKVGSALLRQQILELRLTGMTVRDIARTVHRGPTRVHQILVSALEELAATNAETTDNIVKLELERLDKMVESMWLARAAPEVASALLKVMERRAKLLGLDKPTKTGFVGKDGEFTDAPTLIVEFTDGTSAATTSAAAKGV